MAEVLLLTFAQLSCLSLRSFLFWQGWALLMSYPNKVMPHRMFWLKETSTLESTGDFVVLQCQWRPGMVFEEACLFILVMEYIQPSVILRFDICRFNQPWINTKWNRTSRKFQKGKYEFSPSRLHVYTYICIYIIYIYTHTHVCIYIYTYTHLFLVIPVIYRNVYCFLSLLSNTELTPATESKN